VQRADQLSPAPALLPWLIQDLWTDEAVGILGGEPKCCKSFLALDVAVAVASGAPCLRQFAVRRTGPVLLFPAEDSLSIVRRRLDGIAAAAQVSLSDLPLHVITAPSLRLDAATDRQRLTLTVESLRPLLLILDPFIRLHQCEENEASQIAPLLGYLRQLQRQFHLAVLLVHHAKKDGASLRPGQALRGSSELHGWGDSNLYLRRQRDQLTLTVEHRAAPSLDPIPVQLTQEDAALALGVVVAPSTAASSLTASIPPWQRVLEVLSQTDQPLSVQQVRQRCRLRTLTVCEALQQLCAQGKARRQNHGYLGTAQSASLPADPSPLAPHSQLALPIQPTGNGNGKYSLCSSGG
jgi:RecA-family ATPase